MYMQALLVMIRLVQMRKAKHLVLMKDLLCFKSAAHFAGPTAAGWMLVVCARQCFKSAAHFAGPTAAGWMLHAGFSILLPPEIEETGNRDLETGVLYSSSSLLLNYSLSFSCLELPSLKQKLISHSISSFLRFHALFAADQSYF
ncbi:hypothetical protein AAC387_Pa11g1763 [Persea americana]